ncbi:MAG: Ig-like domain-containing protein, partial [Promethearchaeota archaeon]
QGEHQLFIFANDTAGNLNDTYVFTIFKDTLAPLITINSPINGSYSNSPPIFNIGFYDPNYDSLWYSDGIVNISLVNNTDQTFDMGIWNDIPEGMYQIFCYANDTFGHINNSFTLTLYKDTTAPIITINEPYNNTYYSVAPTFYIISSDPNLDTLWYKIDNYEIVITQLFQNFDALIWNGLDQGEFQIEIFANDTFGHINSTLSLTLYKDTLPPRVVINSPLNQTYWRNTPLLNLTVFDPNLKSIYYRVNSEYRWLDNNTATYLLSYIWNGLPEGAFEIQFYAEDDFGHVNDSYTLTLFKDTIAPTITINNPLEYSLYGRNAPSFDIDVNKFNLQDTWYILINYPEKYLLSEFNGTINQTAWDYFGDGMLIIRFYANDTTGNIGLQDVIVRKDISAPTIIVYVPNEGVILDYPPILNVSITDSNLDSLWYRIGTMYSSLNNNVEQQLDSLIWENLPEGEFHLFISANDSLGNINDSYYLSLYKDTLAPNITINLPIENQEVGDVAPQYDLTIIEDNMAIRWYTLDDGLTNKTFTNNIGQIDQLIWDEIWETHSNGDLITLRFYANDTLSHLGYRDVIIKIKKSSEVFRIKNPTGFIFAGTVEGILGITTISMNTSKKFKRINKKQKKKLNSIFYLALTLGGLLLFTFVF